MLEHMLFKAIYAGTVVMFRFILLYVSEHWNHFLNKINDAWPTKRSYIRVKIKIIQNLLKICFRSLYGVYNGSITIRDNIELWGFAGNEFIFANATVNPENADFCTPLGNHFSQIFEYFSLVNNLILQEIALELV